MDVAQTQDAPPQEAAKEIKVTTRGDFIGLLERLNLSLALSAKPDQIVFLGAVDDALTLHATPIIQAMGMAATAERLAVATARSIVVFANAARLAAHHPLKPDYYDAFFVPRVLHFTGECQMHDMIFSHGGIIGANTNFSCICRIDGTFSFTPLWRPSFITQLRPQDRCHLNGFAGQNGKLRYVTALAATDTAGGWRDLPDSSGILIDAENDTFLRSDLCMPHSPRLIGDELYVLNGGMGELLRIDRQTGKSDVLAALPGFTHGMCELESILFVGLSQNRWSRKKNPPPIAQRLEALVAGVAAVDIKTGALLGMAEFTSGVSEVYDVQPLPGIRRAGMYGLLADDGFVGVETPQSVFWLKRTANEVPHLLDAAATGNYVIRTSL